MKRRFTVLWIIVGFLILFAFLYLPGLSRLQELRSEEERLSKELGEINQKIQKLEEEKNLLQKDQDYLEKVVREELGLVRPGEMVYKLVPEEKSKPKPPSPNPSSHPTARKS